MSSIKQTYEEIVGKFINAPEQIYFKDYSREILMKILNRINAEFPGCLPDIRFTYLNDAILFKWPKYRIQFVEACDFDLDKPKVLYFMKYEIVSVKENYVLYHSIGNTIDDDWETKFFETLKFLNS